MTEAKRARPEKPVQYERGAVVRFLGMVTAMISMVLLAVGLSVLLECVGIVWHWWPSNHAAVLLITERSYIEAIDQYPLTTLSPVMVSERAAQEFDSTWRSIWSGGASHTYVAAAINTVKLILLRLSVCVFTVPGYLFIVLIALLDGLVARDIRKYTGGHESSYVFHKAKRWVIPSLLLTVSVYLMLPFSIPPVVIFAPSMVATGVMVYVAASRFKKYL